MCAALLQREADNAAALAVGGDAVDRLLHQPAGVTFTEGHGAQNGIEYLAQNAVVEVGDLRVLPCGPGGCGGVAGIELAQNSAAHLGADPLAPGIVEAAALRRLGLTELVATDMDRHTGRINGEFAVKQHKLEAFARHYRTEDIDNFYSDSFDDNYLAQCAKHAYAVHDGDKRTDWNTYFQAKLK